jgi:CheY-like chemotaxis protein
MHSCRVLLVHHGFQIFWGQGQGFGMTVVQHGVLRNCENLKGKITEQLLHFSVTSASSGVLAWELLEKRNFQFDLVLTDVILPCLSGLDLLSKIKSYEASKQIPVVMMSTHDSLETVLNCLSKEAADFLVKPVRKNELKNLWQHVWRRCKSSSIGGSRIGTGKEDVPKSHVGSYNNVTGSNGDSENISSGLNVQGGSDNGSGNQVCNIKPFPVLALKVVSVILTEETHSPSLSFDMWSVPALSCIDLRFQEGIQ